MMVCLQTHTHTLIDYTEKERKNVNKEKRTQVQCRDLNVREWVDVVTGQQLRCVTNNGSS